MVPAATDRLPAVTIATGALLAALALALAVWSKELARDGVRFACVERAYAVAGRVRDALALAAARAARGEPGPEVRGAWRVEALGRAVALGPAGEPPPAELLQAALAASSREPVLLPGPPAGAATWLPAERLLVRWDLAALERTLAVPAAGPGDDALGIDTALVPADGPADPPGFQVRATAPVPGSPFAVAAGLRDPAALRLGLRLATFLVGLVAAGLLVLLAASTVLHVRRARARAARQEARMLFLERATHELQTPLALLRAACETLSRGAAGEEADRARCLEILAREEERLTRTVRRLLRYLRLEAGEGAAPSGDEAPARAEVEAAVDEAKAGLEARGVALDVDLTGCPQALLAPRGLLGDAVRELLGNVERHAAGGPRPARRARLTLAARGRARAVLACEDDGPGVDPAVAPRLFEPFAGAGHGHGTGLGLALLRRGVELAGGSVTWRRAEGRTVFEVELPAR